MLDTNGSRWGNTTVFSGTVQPYLDAGWPQWALLPAWPGKKRPGRHLTAGWCGLEGKGLLKHGLSHADRVTPWEQVLTWPTDGLCVLGGAAPAIDVDSEVFEVYAALSMLLPDQTYERGRSNSLRTMLPFRSVSPLKPWRALKFTMPGVEGVQAIEFSGHGKQWIAAGGHRSGGHYVWRDTVGDMDGPPAYADLQPIDQATANMLRVRIVMALESIGAVFVEGSRSPSGANRTGPLDTIETDDLEPLISLETMERVLGEIPDDRDTVGGWDEAIPLLASMRYCLGHLGASLPECVEDWASAFEDSSPEWIEDRWASFDMGVNVREGTFLQWVEKHGSTELSEAVEVEAQRSRTVRGFADVEEAGDDDYGPRPAAGGADAAGGDDGEGDRPAAVGVAQLQDRVPNTVEAEAHILRTLGKEFIGWCEFRHQVILRKPIPWPDGSVRDGFVERPWEDRDDIAVLTYMQANGLRKLGKAIAIDACMSLARKRPFHPVRRYLKGLRWDGVARLDTWLKDYCGAGGDGAWLKAVGHAVLLSAVARVMRPGCKVDTVLVMEGLQGVGKSSLFKALMPVADWFSDSMPHDLSNKDAVSHQRGKWVIEIPELKQFRGTELSALKSFISTAVDVYRPPYGRNEVRAERQGIFVASTNEEGYLSDSTGNRRYWPVKLGDRRMDMGRVEADRDQLWAEAVREFEDGRQWWLTDGEEALAQREQADRLQTDPWAEPVRAYLEANEAVEVSLADLLRHAVRLEQGQQNRGHEMRMADVLKGLGWERFRKHTPGGGMRPWMYRKPAPTSV